MANGGKREGAGRPKGSKDPHTLEREKTLEAVNNRIYKIADSLITAQASVAKGQQFLFRIDTVKSGDGRKKSERKKPILVTNEREIADYIDSLENGDDVEKIDKNTDSYYYITTKEPVSAAVDSLMNRAYGRPKETMDLKVTDETVDLTPLDPKMAEEKKKLLENYHTGLKQIYAKSRKNKDADTH